MNVISHDRAFSLYPVSTFFHCQSIVCGTLSPSERDAAGKYQLRGWHVQDVLNLDEMTTRARELECRRRRVGDARCWTLRLDLNETGPNPIHEGNPCSWIMTPSQMRAGSVDFSTGQIMLTEYVYKSIMLLLED